MISSGTPRSVIEYGLPLPLPFYNLKKQGLGIDALDSVYNAVVLNKSLYVCQCTHNLSDGYVGLVAVGVQEQAEDILVPPQLRNCLTLTTFPFPVIISPPEQWSLP